MNSPDLQNHILTLARAYKIGAENAGDEEVTLLQSIHIVLMGIIEALDDDAEAAPLREFIASSPKAREAVETFLVYAVGSGYALAAEDAIGALERAAGDASAKRN
jgi:hypothetical protein